MLDPDTPQNRSRSSLLSNLHRPRLQTRSSATHLYLDSHPSSREEFEREAFIEDGENDGGESGRSHGSHTSRGSVTAGKRAQISAGFGIKLLRHHDNTHADKLLEYQTEELEQKPWTILFADIRRFSVLDFPAVLRELASCFIVSLAFLFLSLLCEESVVSALSTVGSTVSAGLFFLLGPYVGVSLARWWSTRLDLLGGVWGAVADLNIYAATWFNTQSTADVEARALVMRYGLAAHTLLYKDARATTRSGTWWTTGCSSRTRRRCWRRCRPRRRWSSRGSSTSGRARSGTTAVASAPPASRTPTTRRRWS